MNANDIMAQIDEQILTLRNAPMMLTLTSVRAAIEPVIILAAEQAEADLAAERAAHAVTDAKCIWLAGVLAELDEELSGDYGGSRSESEWIAAAAEQLKE